MATAYSYTLRDGLSMLEAIIETDGKVMPASARKACREILADIKPQLPDDSFRNFKMTKAQVLEYAAKRFKEMHPSSAKRRRRTTKKIART